MSFEGIWNVCWIILTFLLILSFMFIMPAHFTVLLFYLYFYWYVSKLNSIQCMLSNTFPSVFHSSGPILSKFLTNWVKSVSVDFPTAKLSFLKLSHFSWKILRKTAHTWLLLILISTSSFLFVCFSNFIAPADD